VDAQHPSRASAQPRSETPSPQPGGGWAGIDVVAVQADHIPGEGLDRQLRHSLSCRSRDDLACRVSIRIMNRTKRLACNSTDPRSSVGSAAWSAASAPWQSKATAERAGTWPPRDPHLCLCLSAQAVLIYFTFRTGIRQSNRRMTVGPIPPPGWLSARPLGASDLHARKGSPCRAGGALPGAGRRDMRQSPLARPGAEIVAIAL